MKSLSKIPSSLREVSQWVLWKFITRNGDATKVPFDASGAAASSTDSSTWSTFENVALKASSYSGIGFVFSSEDDFCGIDFDGCRDPETGLVSEWAKSWLMKLDSYSEISPSGTGVKVFIRAKSPLASGRKVSIEGAPSIVGKTAAVEVYDRGRYFAVTGDRLARLGPDVNDRQEVLNELCAHFFPAPKPLPLVEWKSHDAVVERARRYLAKLPPSISQQGGHNAAFRAACAIVIGFGLDESTAMLLMQEFNQTCEPPWSDRELAHKVKSAAKQPGPRNYLRDARVSQYDSIQLPNYSEHPIEPELRVTTLEKAAYAYLERVRNDSIRMFDLGLPDVDYAIGGGVESGEMIVLAARPSHGKSAVALQCVHHATLHGYPSIFISEEMSALALGKRTLQYAADVPQEHWKTSTVEMDIGVKAHFEGRAPCFVVESAGSAERAAEAIREAVKQHGVKLAVIDYAQFLRGKGNNKYEQSSDVCSTLRALANETKIVLIVLCQLNREIERRGEFLPTMADIKGTGQFEQDADVILFLCWPHRLDSSRDPSEYVFFVGKNRNRAINSSTVTCKFLPSRQMLTDAREKYDFSTTYEYEEDYDQDPA